MAFGVGSGYLERYSVATTVPRNTTVHVEQLRNYYGEYSFLLKLLD